MPFNKQNSAGFLVNHMARLFAEQLQQRIRPLGIVTGQFPILLELWEKDGVTQRELLEKLDIEQATLANTLTRMERDGLVKRTKHPTDARAQQIWLSEKARIIKGDAYQAALQTNAEALANLSAQERTELLKLMQKVIFSMRT
ncbi:MAG: MarR family winged helix-turn-helix transcriptional regulator [Rhizobiaceae bacterium]